MDCGDAGHILLSKRAAEDLEQHSKWQPRLHHLGEFEVKHGVKIDIINLYTDEIGNPALPEKLKGKRLRVPSRFAQFAKPIVIATLLAAVGLVVVWFFAHRGEEGSVGPPLATIFPGKSVVVLPFKPLVSSNRNEVLEAGMADTLIAKLERVRKIDNWSWIVAEIGCVDALLNKRDEAEKIIAELIARAAHEYIDETLIVYIFLALGEKDQAFAWMEKGYQSRAGELPWMIMEPKFDSVRADPRFDELVRRMGLK